MPQMRSSMHVLRKIIKSKITIGIVVIVAAGIGGYSVFFRRAPTYKFVTVRRGSITEAVSLTGNTVPIQSVSLTFGSGGVISRTYSDIGKQVRAGQVLAELNTNDLMAGIKEAQANVDVQRAKLEKLQAGATPQAIAVSGAALTTAQQALANSYSGVANTLADAYSKANDAVRTQLASFFVSAEQPSVQLSFTTSDAQTLVNVVAQRTRASYELNAWQLENASTTVSAGIGNPGAALTNALAHLATIKTLANSVNITLLNAFGLTSAAAAAYQASASAATNEVNAAITEVSSLQQAIASEIAAVGQAQAQLNLTSASSTPQDIQAQAAQVAQAEASVQSAQAKLQNAQIVAPISGTVTRFDAKIGQLASPSTPLISIMSDTGYEVDAGVSEIDVGKVAVGNKVQMTLDAFPNEIFSGAVFYVAPGETNNQGVVSYEAKIAFDNPDPRLKSGLTANISIHTKNRDNVLILPQYAILQNDSGTFVETLAENKIATSSVTLGIQGQNGNVEIISGVTEGQQVINIGLKSP